MDGDIGEYVRPARALISVTDKTGVVELARALHDYGVEIISTGGTANALFSAGIPVTLVEEITGFPEMLDGRVKTLHPSILAGILADTTNPKHVDQLKERGIKPISIVVCNFYDFAAAAALRDITYEQLIEKIDIGGPNMVRAAVKNNKSVCVVPSVDHYQRLLDELDRWGNDGKIAGTISGGLRREFANDALKIVANYDGLISLTHSKFVQAKSETPRKVPAK